MTRLHHPNSVPASQRLLGSSLAAALLASAMSQPLAAQQASSASDEIIVTAAKRSERLQDVPLAVTALTGDMLKDLGADNFVDFARTVPGLSFTDIGAGRQKITLRGLGVSTGEAVVAYYIGETPIPPTTGTLRLAAVNPKLVDIDRIEVLRGPQGTLYGSSSLGGTIKFIPNGPDFLQTTLQANAGASTTRGGGPGFEADATVNMPVIAEKLAIRASGWYRNIDGFIDRRIIGGNAAAPTLATVARDLPREETYGGRLLVEARPVDAAAVTLLAMHQRQDFDGFQDITIGTTNPGQGEFQDLLADVPEPSRNRFTLLSATVAVDLGPASLLSSTSHYDGELRASEEGTALIQRFFSGSPFANRLVETTGAKSFTQEVRLATSDSILGFDLLLGLFYQNLRTSRLVDWAPPGWNDRFAPDGPSNGNFTPGNDLFTSIGRGNQKETSFFGELSYNFTDTLKATGGLRAYNIKSRSTASITGLLDDSSPGVRTTDNNAKSRGHVVKGNLSWMFAPMQLAYLQYTEGFRPGFGRGALPDNCAADLANLGVPGTAGQVLPDTTANYEVGLKTRFAGGRITINAAAYRIDWQNIQQSLFLPCGLTLIANAGEARNKGFELEAQARVSDMISVGGTLGYVDARLRKDAPAFGASAGDRIADVPEWQGSAYIGLEMPIGDALSLTGRVDYQYTGPAWLDFRQVAGERDPLSRRDALNLVNIRAGVRSGPWRVTIHATNLFDASARQSRAESLVLDVPGRPRFVLNRPRTVGINGSVEF